MTIAYESWSGSPSKVRVAQRAGVEPFAIEVFKPITGGGGAALSRLLATASTPDGEVLVAFVNNQGPGTKNRLYLARDHGQTPGDWTLEEVRSNMVINEPPTAAYEQTTDGGRIHLVYVVEEGYPVPPGLWHSHRLETEIGWTDELVGEQDTENGTVTAATHVNLVTGASGKPELFYVNLDIEAELDSQDLYEQALARQWYHPFAIPWITLVNLDWDARKTDQFEVKALHPQNDNGLLEGDVVVIQAHCAPNIEYRQYEQHLTGYLIKTLKIPTFLPDDNPNVQWFDLSFAYDGNGLLYVSYHNVVLKGLQVNTYSSSLTP